MAHKDTWKPIAQAYRDREHNLLKALKLCRTFEDVQQAIDTHLKMTGRNSESPLETSAEIIVDPDIKNSLLAVLGANQGQQTVSVGPKLNKDGTPRKQRSDKGKKRGSYK